MVSFLSSWYPQRCSFVKHPRACSLVRVPVHLISSLRAAALRVRHCHEASTGNYNDRYCDSVVQCAPWLDHGSIAQNVAGVRTKEHVAGVWNIRTCWLGVVRVFELKEYANSYHIYIYIYIYYMILLLFAFIYIYTYMYIYIYI